MARNKTAAKGNKAVARPRRKSKSAKSKTGIEAFKMALTDPFSEAADGARVPDLFSAPTEARSYTTSFTVTSDASGNIDYMAFANPRYTGFSGRSNLTGGGTFVLAANSGVTVANSASPGTGNDISTEFVNYRVVGWGMRVQTISNMTQTQGTVNVASVPYAGYVPHEIVVGGQPHSSGNSGTLGDFYSWSGIPVTGSLIDVSKAVSMDNVVEKSATSLATAPITFVSRPIDPRAYQFRMSGDTRFGYDIQGQTSTTYISAGNASQADASGWLIPVLTGTGFVPSTACLRIELTYKLEGTPAYSVSQMHSGGTSQSPVDFQGYIQVLSEVAQSEPFKMVAGSALRGLGLSPLAHLIGL